MPLLSRARRSRWLASALDGVNASAIALMAAVAFQLGRTSLVDWFTLLIGLAALGLLVRLRVNPTWLVLAGAAIGLLHRLA